MTLDPKVAPAEYNYRNKAEMEAAVGHSVKMEGEDPGCGGGFLCAAGIVVYLYSLVSAGEAAPEQ